MSYIAALKGRVIELEDEVERLQSLLDTFFSGNVPHNASPDHFVLAKWGRRRLEEMQTAKPVAALLQPK